MKYVCTATCQYRNRTGSIRMASPGGVVSFEKDPGAHWSALETEELSFITASEDVLKETTWSFEAAFEAVKEEFNVEIKKTDKDDVIKQILDARYRQVD